VGAAAGSSSVAGVSGDTAGSVASAAGTGTTNILVSIVFDSVGAATGSGVVIGVSGDTAGVVSMATGSGTVSGISGTVLASTATAGGTSTASADSADTYDVVGTASGASASNFATVAIFISNGSGGGSVLVNGIGEQIIMNRGGGIIPRRPSTDWMERYFKTGDQPADRRIKATVRDDQEVLELVSMITPHL